MNANDSGSASRPVLAIAAVLIAALSACSPTAPVSKAIAAAQAASFDFVRDCDYGAYDSATIDVAYQLSGADAYGLGATDAGLKKLRAWANRQPDRCAKAAYLGWAAWIAKGNDIDRERAADNRRGEVIKRTLPVPPESKQ